MLIAEYQTHYDTVASLITAFCDQHLDADYKVICFHALDKLSRKRPFPFLTGRDQMWAAGIVYAIAQNCYLIGNQYDLLCGKPKYHFTSDEIAGAFGVSKGSASAKAKAIREQLGIRNDRNEWLPPDMREMNTMVKKLRKALGIRL